MKNLMLLILLTIILISCESSEDAKITHFSLIGAVNVPLKKIELSGMVSDSFLASYYLDGIKVDLLKNNKLIKTTYSVKTKYYGKYYIFDNLELNTAYKIVISINEFMTDTTSEFIVKESDLKLLPSAFPYSGLPDLDTKKKYYMDLIYDNDYNISFDLYTNPDLLSMRPNPLINTGTLSFVIMDSGNVEIDILDIQHKFTRILHRNYYVKRNYDLTIDTNIADGLYYFRILTQGKQYKCPFLKGEKGYLQIF